MGATERRYDLDWIRVIGMGVVFTHHVTMYFNSWSWHAKSAVTSPAFVPFNLAVLTWIMPLFFLISGFATYRSLTSRSAGLFLRERLLRLGVPVLAGIFLLAPYLVYSERMTYGQVQGGLLAFLPRYFEGWYGITPGGNFAWMGLHAWYLLFLLLFTVVTLPFLVRTGISRATGVVGWLFQSAGPLGILLLPPILLFVLEGVLFGLGLDIGLSGWPLGVYLTCYILGYTLLPSEGYRQAVRRVGSLAILGGLATVVPVAFIPEPTGFSAAFIAWQSAKVFSCWFLVIGLFYLGDRYLGRNSTSLRYWSEAAMPFYMLHQPVIVALGFGLRTLHLPLPTFFPLFYLATLLITLAVYHLVVRHVDPLRFLLGMKPRRSEAAVGSHVASPA